VGGGGGGGGRGYEMILGWKFYYNFLSSVYKYPV